MRQFPKDYGAGEWARTIDLLITNQLLYQLSYAGVRRTENRNILAAPDDVRQCRTTCVTSGRRSSAPDDARQSRTPPVSAGRRAPVPDDVRQSRTTPVSARR